MPQRRAACIAASRFHRSAFAPHAAPRSKRGGAVPAVASAVASRAREESCDARRARPNCGDARRPVAFVPSDFKNDRNLGLDHPQSCARARRRSTTDETASLRIARAIVIRGGRFSIARLARIRRRRRPIRGDDLGRLALDAAGSVRLFSASSTPCRFT